jgi:molybdopterin synthase sulfur carrier subunit
MMGAAGIHAAMEVTVYGQLRGATGKKTVVIDFEGGAIREAIEAFVDAYPRADRHLYDEDGDLESGIRLALDGETVAADTHCPPDASLAIHPAMQGG